MFLREELDRYNGIDESCYGEQVVINITENSSLDLSFFAVDALEREIHNVLTEAGIVLESDDTFSIPTIKVDRLDSKTLKNIVNDRKNNSNNDKKGLFEKVKEILVAIFEKAMNVINSLISKCLAAVDNFANKLASKVASVMANGKDNIIKKATDNVNSWDSSASIKKYDTDKALSIYKDVFHSFESFISDFTRYIGQTDIANMDSSLDKLYKDLARSLDTREEYITNVSDIREKVRVLWQLEKEYKKDEILGNIKDFVDPILNSKSYIMNTKNDLKKSYADQKKALNTAINKAKSMKVVTQYTNAGEKFETSEIISRAKKVVTMMTAASSSTMQELMTLNIWNIKSAFEVLASHK